MAQQLRIEITGDAGDFERAMAGAVLSAKVGSSEISKTNRSIAKDSERAGKDVKRAWKDAETGIIDFRHSGEKLASWISTTRGGPINSLTRGLGNVVIASSHVADGIDKMIRKLVPAGPVAEKIASGLESMGISASSVTTAFSGMLGVLSVLGPALLALPAVVGIAAAAFVALLDAVTIVSAGLLALAAPVTVVTGLLGGLGLAFGYVAAQSLKNKTSADDQRVALAKLQSAQGTYNDALAKYGKNAHQTQSALGTLLTAQDAYKKAQLGVAISSAHLDDKFQKLIQTLSGRFAPTIRSLVGDASRALTYLDKVAKLPLAQAFKSLSTTGVKGVTDFIQKVGFMLAKPFRLAIKFGFGVGGDTLSSQVKKLYNELTNYLTGPGGALNPVVSWFNRQDFTKTGLRWADEIIHGIIGLFEHDRAFGQSVRAIGADAAHAFGAAFSATLKFELNELWKWVWGTTVGKWVAIGAAIVVAFGPVFTIFTRIYAFLKLVGRAFDFLGAVIAANTVEAEAATVAEEEYAAAVEATTAAAAEATAVSMAWVRATSEVILATQEAIATNELLLASITPVEEALAVTAAAAAAAAPEVDVLAAAAAAAAPEVDVLAAAAAAAVPEMDALAAAAAAVADGEASLIGETGGVEAALAATTAAAAEATGANEALAASVQAATAAQAEYAVAAETAAAASSGAAAAAGEAGAAGGIASLIEGGAAGAAAGGGSVAGGEAVAGGVSAAGIASTVGTVLALALPVALVAAETYFASTAPHETLDQRLKQSAPSATGQPQGPYGFAAAAVGAKLHAGELAQKAADVSQALDILSSALQVAKTQFGAAVSGIKLSARDIRNVESVLTAGEPKDRRNFAGKESVVAGRALAPNEVKSLLRLSVDHAGSFQAINEFLKLTHRVPTRLVTNMLFNHQKAGLAIAAFIGVTKHLPNKHQLNVLSNIPAVAIPQVAKFIEKTGHIPGSKRMKIIIEGAEKVQKHLDDIKKKLLARELRDHQLHINVATDPVIQKLDRLKGHATKLFQRADFVDGGRNISEGVATGIVNSSKQITTSLVTALQDAQSAAQTYATNNPIIFPSKVTPPTNPSKSGKEAGGQVAPNTVYLTGERGREMFVPGGYGTMLPHSETEKVMRSLAGAMANDKAPYARPLVPTQVLNETFLRHRGTTTPVGDPVVSGTVKDGSGTGAAAATAKQVRHVMDMLWSVVGPRFFRGYHQPPVGFYKGNVGTTDSGYGWNGPNRHITLNLDSMYFVKQPLAKKYQLTRNGQIKTILHEWAHAFQKLSILPGAGPKIFEGGAEAFAQRTTAEAIARAGLQGQTPGYSDRTYPAWTDYIRSHKNGKYVLFDQMVDTGRSEAFKRAQVLQFRYHARGGNYWPGEVSVVGENGPEVKVEHGAGRYVPNQDTRRMMGGEIHNHFEFPNAIVVDRKSVDYLARLMKPSLDRMQSRRA